MKRYALKCGQCGQIIGYMSLWVDGIGGTYVMSETGYITMGKQESFPICCPACEVVRVRKERVRKEVEENESKGRLES